MKKLRLTGFCLCCGLCLLCLPSIPEASTWLTQGFLGHLLQHANMLCLKKAIATVHVIICDGSSWVGHRRQRRILPPDAINTFNVSALTFCLIAVPQMRHAFSSSTFVFSHGQLCHLSLLPAALLATQHSAVRLHMARVPPSTMP